MSKSISGLKQEIDHSKIFHREGIPILVSARLLRERGLGQLDLVRLVKNKNIWLIEGAEVKSSEMGMNLLVVHQERRILSALRFLSGLLGFASRLIKLVG